MQRQERKQKGKEGKRKGEETEEGKEGGRESEKVYTTFGSLEMSTQSQFASHRKNVLLQVRHKHITSHQFQELNYFWVGWMEQ